VQFLIVRVQGHPMVLSADSVEVMTLGQAKKTYDGVLVFSQNLPDNILGGTVSTGGAREDKVVFTPIFVRGRRSLTYIYEDIYAKSLHY